MKLKKEDIEDVYNLSPIQEGILFHCLKDATPSLYLEQLCLKINGGVTKLEVEDAFNVVISNNDILRSIFVWLEIKVPHQFVLKEYKVAVEELIVPHVDQEQTFINNIKSQDLTVRFDLTTVPIRLKLINFHSGAQYILFTYHHIILDGWSMGLVLKELFTNLNWIREKKALAPSHKVKFKEYIRNISNRVNTYQDFWKGSFSGFESHIPLSILNTNISGRYDAQDFIFNFKSDFKEKVDPFLRNNHITFASFIYGIWAIALQKYNNSFSSLFGITNSGRNINLMGVDEMVGVFINTFPVFIENKNDITAIECMNNIANYTFALEEQSGISLSKIKEYAGISPSSLFFDTLVVIENYPIDNLKNPDNGSIYIDEFYFKEQTNYDLTFQVSTNRNIEFKFLYNGYSVDKETLKRFAKHLEYICEQIIINPYIKVNNIGLCSFEEKEIILNDFNNTLYPYPKKPVQSYLEDYASHLPDNVALIHNGESITYKRLNEEANQIANYLRQSGIKPNDIIAVCCERSSEMIVTLYGIIKAGAAYLPLSVSTPIERLLFVINDSKAKILFCDDHVISKNEIPIPVVAINDQAFAIYSVSNPPLINKPDDLVYVIYTSGSTGFPKGVMIEHAGFTNRLLWMRKEYNISESDVLIHKTPYTFDVSVWELFLGLFSASKLVVCNEKDELDLDKLMAKVTSFGVSVIHFVPSMLDAFLDYVEINSETLNLSSLRYLICSGEALNSHQVLRFYRIIKSIDARIINFYGPTEASIDVSYFNTFPNAIYNIIPIGKPIDNIKLFILDNEENLQPIGVPGELCIAGVGLSKGYINNPLLTNDRFTEVEAPENTRIYKTGDVAKFDCEGNIHYLGRADSQIKIRGVRVELSEIEQTILRLPQVKNVVVVYKEIGNTNRLIAYITGSVLIKEDEVKEYLRKNIPEFMIPDFFVFLDQFPLNPSGKVDKKALPEPKSKDNVHKVHTNETQRIIASIWAQVLKVEEISIDSQFFELGGDSIKAIQVTSRINRHFPGFRINTLLNYPTIEGLADFLDKHSFEDHIEEEDKDVCLLSPIQQWFFSENFAQVNYYNQSILLFNANGYNPDDAQEVIKMLVTKHPMLRAKYFQEKDVWYQKIESIENLRVDFQVTDLLAFGDIDLSHKTFRETVDKNHSGIDIVNGPVLKCSIIRTKKGDYLSLVIHHLIVDGVSWRILIDEFTFFYNELNANQKPKIDNKKNHYFKWIENLYEYSKSEQIERQVPYWKELNNYNHLLFPVDSIIDGEEKKYGACTSSFVEIEKGLFSNVKEKSKNEGFSLQELFLTAFLLALEQWASDSMLLIDLEGHGRDRVPDRIDISDCVGWFTSHYPAVFNLGGLITVREKLDYVKNYLKNIPNKGIDYGILKYITFKEMPPLFEVQPEIKFNYLGEFTNTIGTHEIVFFNQSTGKSIGDDNARNYKIECNIIVLDDVCVISLTYNHLEYTSNTIVEITNAFQEVLNKMTVCSDERAGAILAKAEQ